MTYGIYARVNLFSQNERASASKCHTKALPMNKFVYFIDTEFFYIHSRNTSNLSFHKTYSVSFDNNRTVQSTTQILYFVLTLKKFITKTKFRQQNVFIPLAFHIKCANNFNNSKTQHQAKNIKVYIFLSEAIR